MQNERDIPPPDGGYGWVIIVACVLINMNLTPLMQCFGLIFEEKFNEMNISAAEISFLLHFHNSIMCSLGLLSGPILKKYNFRQTSLFGCFLVCMGITLTIFVCSYGELIFTICILIGTGQGILMPSTALATNTYFKKRITLAMSYSITGVGLLPIVMPQICTYFLFLYGTRGTILILSGLSLHSFIGALLLRPLSKKENGSENILSSVNDEAAVRMKAEENGKWRKLFASFNLELFKERVYVIIIVGMAISYVAELNFTLMTPFVLYELAGFSNSDVALIMSIQAIADICGRLFIPIVSYGNNWSPKVMYALSLIGSSLGRTVLAIWCDTKNIVFNFWVLIGLSKGVRAVFQSLILPKYINIEQLPSAMGFLMVFNGILSLGIGSILGFIHDLTDSYTYALHTSTLLSSFCVILWVLDGFVA